MQALFRDARTRPPGEHPRDELKLAAAVVLVEAARADAAYDDAERAAIVGALERRFGLDSAEATALVHEAETVQAESTELHRFVRTINRGFSPEERVALLEILWEVVYADGALDPYEAALMRRVGGLLYVPDRERGEARKRVLRRLRQGAARAI